MTIAEHFATPTHGHLGGYFQRVNDYNEKFNVRWGKIEFDVFYGVQANVKAMLSGNSDVPGNVFNIAVGANFSVNQLYTETQKLLGSDHKPTYRETRKGDIRNSLADISKAQKLIGYVPEFFFGQGLAITVAYFKDHFTEN